ncbi:hypothetical protein P7C70_g4934, partial [Phenoliferia sp. Uapishka_3]
MTPLPSPINLSYLGHWDKPDTESSKWAEGDPMSAGSGGGGSNSEHWRETSGGSDGSSGSGHPTRSKTASFFSDTDTFMSSLGALSPPPNPPSRSNSLRSIHTTRSSRKSWLDSEDGHGYGSPQVQPESDSPETSPMLSPTVSRLRGVPSFDLSQLPPAPSLPSQSSEFSSIAPFPTAPKPVLPAIKTTTREPSSPYSGSPPSSFFTSTSRPMSSLPSAVESNFRPGARFLNHGPMSRFGTLDVPPTGSSTPSRSGTSTPRGTSPGTSAGSRPITPASWQGEEADEEDCPPVVEGEEVGDFEVVRVLGKGAFSRVALAKWKGKGKEGEEPRGEADLVALKLITRQSYEGNERMRISVVREVEVLKRIHHPSLVSLSSSFTTPIYTVLALDYAPGGELFDFLATWHSEMTEPLVRRMFGELASAVGWMHSIGLVHRDIKLENILLTSRPFPCLDPTTLLASLPTPFLKLTDFGLSRFISPDTPLLSTRCGSEAYAAPELIMGKKYDGRRTDAWALGVVLYALITGGMPFVEDSDGRGRKGYLLKIAKAEVRWPSSAPSSMMSPASPPRSAGSTGSFGSSNNSDLDVNASMSTVRPVASELGRPTMSTDATRLVTPSLKALVGKLLVRDPEKRAKVDDLWGMEWMQGEGRPEKTIGWVSPRKEGDTDGGREVWSRELLDEQ